MAIPAEPATPSASYKMITIPEAQQLVLHHAEQLQAEHVSLSASLGRILSEDVVAAEPLPPCEVSFKDGYAVVSTDGQGEYEVAFEALAGMEQQQLQPGSIAYIGTGGALPRGADAVVQIEDTAVVGRSASGKPIVHIKIAVKTGHDVRATGSDIQAGQPVLATGDRIGSAEIGLLATVGAAHVQVTKAPLVAVLSTGDELVEASIKSLPAGAIRDANRPMLLSAVAEAGGTAMDLGIVADSAGLPGLEAALCTAVDSAVDVLITSGGVSMGDKDLVKPLLEKHATVHFGRVLMKPGKPLTFATMDISGPKARKMLVFGLPGNPVSSLVTFNLVVLPALRRMSGWREPMLRRLQAYLGTPVKLDPMRPEYHRASLRWSPPSPVKQQPQETTSSSAPKESVQCTVTGCEFEDLPMVGTPPRGFTEEENRCFASAAHSMPQHEKHLGGFVASSTGGQTSSRLLSMRSATALLELPKAAGVLPAGSQVSALLISDLH